MGKPMSTDVKILSGLTLDHSDLPAISTLGIVSTSQQQLMGRKLTSMCIFFPITHSKKVFSRVWKQLSLHTSLSWRGSQTWWGLEQGELSPEASWRLSPRLHVPALQKPTVPGEGPQQPPAALPALLCPHKTGPGPNPNLKLSSWEEVSLHRQSPTFSMGRVFRKHWQTLTISEVPRRHDSLESQLSLARTRQLFPTSPSTKRRCKDSPVDGTLTWRN